MTGGSRASVRRPAIFKLRTDVESTALGTVAGLLVIPQALLLAHIIDALFLKGAAPSAVGSPLSLLAVLSVARAALVWRADVHASSLAADTKRTIRSSIAARVLSAGPRWLDHQRTGAFTGTLAGGADALDPYIASYRPQRVLAVIVPAAVLAAVVLVDPLSGLVLAVTGPLIPLFMWLLGGVARERTARQWRDLTRLGARFLDALQGLVTLRAFGQVDAEARALAAAADRFRVLTMETLRMAFLSSLTLELLATLGTAIVAVEVGLRLLYGWLPFADAFGVLLLTPEFYRPLRTLGASFHAGLAGREAMRHLEQIDVALPRVDVDPAPAPAMATPIPGSPPGLTFDRVVVAYAGGRAAALDGLSITVAPGEFVGLAGASGGGKSTLLALLLRFRAPEDGVILVDGQPLETWPAATWRRAISWAPQRPHLFHGTVRDNLCLGRPAATAGEIAEAVRRAAFDDVVRRLPQGLDSPIGEHGMRLSGGEAQRLALARAYLKPAPVLLLDEPTSDLDAEIEARVLDGLDEVRHGRTTLLVSHRATTLRAADRVVTIGAGSAVS